MTIYYEEFDSTPATVRADLATKIAAHADWDDITPTFSSTTTVATGTGPVNFTMTSVSGFYIGCPVKITVSGTDYYRYIINISGLVITINLSFPPIAPAGQVIATDLKLLKATTARGGQMVVDLHASARYTDRLGFRCFHTHTGVSPTTYTGIGQLKTVHWSASGAGLADTAPLHVVLSVSKEHLFISIEGPRGSEPGATSTIYGSARNYMFMSDVIPYHAADTTPAVVVWGINGEDNTPLPSELHWRAEVSRNSVNTTSWGYVRLPTIAMPHFGNSGAPNVTNRCTIDGKDYLWPYLVIQDDEGLRGRLARIFFVGLAQPSYASDAIAPVGELITYGGIVYKTLLVSKSDALRESGGGLGLYTGSSTADVFKSPVVAVPYAVA